MDAMVVDRVLQVAGIAGLALLVFYYLLRELVSKNMFASLSRAQSYRLMRWMLLAIWSVVVLSIAAWLYVGSRGGGEATPGHGGATRPDPGSPETEPDSGPGTGAGAPEDPAPSPPPPEVEPGNIAVENRAWQIGPQQWQWTVFIVSDPATQAQVQCVEYTLHESFGNQRFNRVCDPTDGFALSATGWGVFEIQVRVVFRDGTDRYLTHLLKL